MNHCKTCKHWRPYKDEFPRSLGVDGRAFGGICKSDKLMEEYSFDDYADDHLVYPYSEGGYFWTGANFGCVHHEISSANQELAEALAATETLP